MLACKTASLVFLKIGLPRSTREILERISRASHAHVDGEKKFRVSPQFHSLFSPSLQDFCLTAPALLTNAKIWTVLQSTSIFDFWSMTTNTKRTMLFVCTLISIPVMNDRSVRAHRWNCLKAEAHKVLLLSEIKTIKRRSLFGIFTKSGCYQTGNEERGTNNGTGKWKKQNQKQNKKPREQRMGNGVTDRARD